MARALAPHPAPAQAPSPARKMQHHHSSLLLDRLGQQQHSTSILLLHRRRAFIYGLVGAGAGAGLGSAIHGGEAKGAARRPPPPPATEKKDPNLSGVQAKVLASKKRKEAMKEAISKLRERGKPIREPVNETPQ